HSAVCFDRSDQDPDGLLPDPDLPQLKHTGSSDQLARWCGLPSEDDDCVEGLPQIANVGDWHRHRSFVILGPAPSEAMAT
ncbi:MAG TPA: hypothetical protein VNS34_12080, partial [Rhizobiaceae bacterium]|nr:hypothetical protein [Rhizobiaceae bacterium]